MSDEDADEIGAYILGRFARVDLIFPNRTDEKLALMYAAAGLGCAAWPNY